MISVKKLDFEKTILPKIREYADGTSKQMEEWARHNHHWENRTRAAQDGLTAYTAETKDEILIGVGHTVEYGRYLETAHDGKHGVLRPMLEHFEPIVKAGLGKVIHGGA